MRDAARHQATDDALREKKQHRGTFSNAPLDREDDRRDHRSEQERRGQPCGFQNENDDRREREQDRPLDRTAAEKAPDPW